MPDLRLSVVVVSTGRPRALARCLIGLSQMRSIRFEVTVVADEDGLAVARSLPFAGRLTLLEQGTPNISRARNAGVAAAAGDIIGFIDDDAVPEPTWAEAVIQAFEEADLAAVSGPVLGRNGISLQWGRMATDALGRDRWLSDGETPTPGEALKLHGTNMAFRREALQRVGGFDPAFAFYLDETDAARRLCQTGERLAYVPGAIVHHGYAASARRSAARMPLDLFDIGASTVMFLRKHAPAADKADALQTLRADQRSRLWRFVKRRKLDAGQMRELMESLEAGIVAGEGRTSEFVSLPAPERAFAAMRDSHPPAMRVLSGWWHSGGRIRQEARRHVSAGAPVTAMVFEPTPRKMKVRFTDGGWWEHTGGLYGPSKRSEPRVQAWRFSSRLGAELKRVSQERGID